MPCRQRWSSYWVCTDKCRPQKKVINCFWRWYWRTRSTLQKITTYSYSPNSTCSDSACSCTGCSCSACLACSCAVYSCSACSACSACSFAVYSCSACSACFSCFAFSASSFYSNHSACSCPPNTTLAAACCCSPCFMLSTGRSSDYTCYTCSWSRKKSSCQTNTVHVKAWNSTKLDRYTHCVQ